MRLIVIEGPDGSGHSTHADLLATALRAAGLDAESWHHTRPAKGDPYLDALSYAQQRADLVVSAPRAIVVADRWYWSTLTEGLARGQGGLRDLATAEAAWLPKPLASAVLDAPDAELGRRLTDRGETVEALDHARRLAYRRVSHLFERHVDTSVPVAEVTRVLLEMAVRALRRST